MSDQNIIQVKWYGKHRVTYRGNRQNETINNNNGERVGKQRGSRIDTTEVGCGVVGGVGISHLVSDGHRGVSPIRLKELAMDYGSHSTDHNVQH
jgi:hypothetical protein